MSEFFAMGGYGFFVWTSYAITAIVLVANVIIACRKNRQVTQDLRKNRSLKP